MKRSNLILLCIAVLALLAFVPKAEEPIERLVSSLQKWVDKNPQEKVYLHMDKPYYALGDTVWFKAYVTIGSRHQLSKLSGALYVELIDEKDSLLSSLKLPLTAGMALGDFTLGDEYKAGNFRIRAYTQWMRNAGEEYFFDKSFVVADPLDAGSAAIDKGKAVQLSGSDVQFFPEGGSLVNGINSRMGFKAVAANGRGIGVKGVVTDNAGIEVSNFETLHAGMGVFNFRPEAGKTYKAKVTFSDGSEKSMDLPKALEQGYVLSVYQPGPDSVLVRINASPAQYQIPYAVDLMVQSGGETVSATTVKINKAVNSVWLMKKDFPSGIAQFTLFDGRGEAINERIAFIRAKDQMQLVLNSAKKVYKSRERVELDMEARDKSGKPVAGNFSVSVIDESKVPNDENAETTIFSSMLLSSDIKGYIEEPNYYFRKDTAEVNKALDNLMLTQGYRRFVWKHILSTTTAGSTSRYPAESLGTEISGRVLTLSGKPVVNGQVTVMSLTPGFMEQAKTDADGRFKYLPIMLADSLRFAVQARTEKNSNKVEVLLDSIPRQVIGKNWNIPGFTSNIEESTKTYLENSRKQDDLLGRTGGQSRANRLKEVVIKAQKGESIQYASQGGLRIPEGSADQTYFLKDPGNCPSLNVCLTGRLIGVMSDTITIQRIQYVDYPYLSYEGKKAPLGIILNGRKLDPLEIADFWTGSLVDPEDIVKIDMVRSNQALISYVGKTMLVYTRRQKKAPYNPSIANIKPKGFNKAREFYAPRYDRPNIAHQLPDLRSTIYWNPKLKTDSLGKGSFSFFNADGPGSYKVIVEGINAAGELARQVYQYEVTAGPQAQLADLPSGNTAELVKAMQNLQQNKAAEKLYVHTDKPYYNLGDTIWFKAYLFDAASLSASKRSGLLYLELNDDTAEAVRRISIPLKDGVGYAQIPLNRKIFHEGGYTLRAYTNWMQNFGDDYFFTQRFYFGVPTKDTWLVKSSSKINKVADKDQLQTELTLSRPDQSAAALRDVEVRMMEGTKVLSKEKLQTGADGKLEFKYDLKDKADGRNIKAEIRSLHPSDHNQLLVVPLNVARDQHIDLQFLPEGGNLVAGLKSLVGFKALAEDGRGINISGEIYDSKGSLTASFSSLYNGMGAFEFNPQAGETYVVRLNQPGLTDKTFELPKVRPEGTVLHIDNEEQNDSLVVQLSSSAKAVQTDSTYYLMATSRGLVTFARAIDLQKGLFSIPKSAFPSGITRFTVLRNKTPLNERMVFIDKKDNIRVSLTANKSNYVKRDSVAVLLEVKDKDGNPLKGNFSLAVTDNSQVKPDTLGDQSIATALLVNADLKGTIETPGYYLNRQNKDSWQALDNLMLTQGWVGYDWKEAFLAPKPVLFAAEKHFRVKGLVNNLLGKGVAGAQILISSQKPFFITNTITDDHGNYVFENLPPIDSGSFFIQAKTPKGKTMNFGEVTVDRFKAPAVPERLRDQILPWYVNSDVAQLNYVKHVALKAEEGSLKTTGIALKEVKIIDKKIIKGSFNRNGPGNADLVFDEQDIKESGVMSLYALLKQKLPGIRITQQDGFATLKLNAYMVVISIDGGGLPIHISDTTATQELFDELNEVKIANFKGLEVMYSRKYTSGTYEFPQQVIKFPSGSEIMQMNAAARAAGHAAARWPYYKPGYIERYLDARVNFLSPVVREIAVIEITTGNKHGWQTIRKPNVATLRPLPVMRPQEFYSPKYTSKSVDAAEPDFRSTVYWKPDVLTDGQGKARVVFYTSDVAGTYTLNLQGSDMDGNIGSFTSVIKVQ
ncbi:MAG: carboxypeptidase-like regulatory domain-containing protein [Bacteroidota bacterium]